jgi:Icc protein
MLIAQISDTHIPKRGAKTYGIAPMAENLARCIEHINKSIPKPDVVLVTGDITNTGIIEETEHAATLLAQLQCPFYVIPGNHDDRSTLNAAFDDNAHPPGYQGFSNYVIEGFDVRLIAMDSTVPGSPGGEICHSRAEWLDQRLSEFEQQPTVIFMHHPPVMCGVLETDMDGFSGVDLLSGVVNKYNNIERIVCGHIHLPTHARWHGTVVSTAPSMGMQLGLDLTLKKPSEFILEAPAYQLHYWTPQKDLVTHTVYVRDVDGPYPF